MNSTSNILNYSEVNQNGSLSPSSYIILDIPNMNFKILKNIIKEKIKGVEVGSKNYVPNSHKFFMRTRSLKQESILPMENSVSVSPMKPKAFVDQKLTKGTILICKDSNVGETVYLSKKLSDHVISTGIHALKIPKNELYVMGFMKTPFFKNQIIAPSGVTIRHGKESYLKCKIPFPSDSHTLIQIEKLVKAWIDREQQIITKYNSINKKITQLINDVPDNFEYTSATYSSIKKNRYRLDSGINSYEYAKLTYDLKHCAESYFTIDSSKIKIGNTPEKRIYGKGKNWIRPESLNRHGYYMPELKILCKKYNMQKPTTLLVNRTGDGQLDDDVCLATFYNVTEYGPAQCNQGFYLISDYDDDTLKLIALLFNTDIYRKLYKLMSAGAVLREIKKHDVCSIPFLDLDTKTKNKLLKLYSNNVYKKYSKSTLNNISENDKKYINNLGILELSNQIHQIRNFLINVFEKIVHDKKYTINEEIILLRSR